jgi:hypothetical protein
MAVIDPLIPDYVPSRIIEFLTNCGKSAIYERNKRGFWLRNSEKA